MNDTEKIFLNGKNQIVEMLKYMSIDERGRLLRNIKMKNPQLANELAGQVLTFRDIFTLPQETVRTLLQKIDPKIIGLALKNLSENEQREMLRHLNRENALIAYDTMKNYTGSRTNELVKRAQEKLIHEMAINLKNYNSRLL